MLTTPEPAWGSEVNKDTLSVKRYQFAGVRYENKQCHVYCHKFLCVAPRARAAQLCYKGGNFLYVGLYFQNFPTRLWSLASSALPCNCGCCGALNTALTTNTST